MWFKSLLNCFNKNIFQLFCYTYYLIFLEFESLNLFPTISLLFFFVFLTALPTNIYSQKQAYHTAET